MSVARSSASRRRHAGSILKKLNLAKVRSAIGLTIAMGALIAASIAVLLALRLAGCGFHGDPTSVLASPGPRLWEIADRRGSVIGVALLAWGAALAVAMLASRGRAGRPGARLLALSLVYLPLVCLAGAALEPGVGEERLLVMLGAPALALLTLAALDGYRALAAACGATTLAYTVDVIAGSPLTRLSLLGPNPAGGHRFYGVGNELEAILTVLVLAGTGAAISGFAPRLDRRRGAAAFLVVGRDPQPSSFASGRFGADVGAAIVLPLGAAVAAALLAGRPPPRPARLRDAAAGSGDPLGCRPANRRQRPPDPLRPPGRKRRRRCWPFWAGACARRGKASPGRWSSCCLPSVAAALLAWRRRERLAAWLPGTAPRSAPA